MTDRFVLRALSELDLDTAAVLHRAAFAPMGERTWTRQDVAGLLASPAVRGLLLQLDGKDIGFVLSRIAVDEAELLTIAIDPGHRRRGAGRALLEAAIERAHTDGARSLFLEVGADNPAARSLYEQSGFVSIGRRKAYYQRGAGAMADAVVMRLTMEPSLKRDG